MKKALLFVAVLMVIGAVSFTHKDRIPFIGGSREMEGVLSTSTIQIKPEQNIVTPIKTPVSSKKLPAHYIEKITPSSAKRLSTIQIYGNGFFESSGYAFFFFETADGQRAEVGGTVSTSESGLRVAKVVLKEPCTPGERVVGTNIGYIGKCSSPYLSPGEYKVYSGIDANQTNKVPFTIVP